MRDLWRGELFWKAPDLAPAGDRRIIIKIHGVHIAAFLDRPVGGSEAHRDNLAGLRIIAKGGRIGHADEFIIDRVANDFERFRHHLAESVGIGPVTYDNK